MLKRFVPLEKPDGITNKYNLPTTYIGGDITLFVNGQLINTRNIQEHPLGYILNEDLHFFEFFTPLFLGDTLYVIYDDSQECGDITSGGGVINLTFAGTVYDSKGIPTDAYYQVYVINKNVNLTKWSSVRETEFTDYNINIGDPDLSSQDNYLLISNKGNEFILIAVWTKDSESRNNYAKESAYIVYELHEEVVYIQDIKLNKISPITCDNWSVQENTTAIEPIIALSQNTNEFSYNAFDILHFMFKYYETEIVFDYLGVINTEYNFGDGFGHSNVFLPKSSSEINVQIRVTDTLGQQATCSKLVKVYLKIEIDFDWSPKVIYTGDNVYITSTIFDVEPLSVKFVIDGIEFLGKDVVYTTQSLHEIHVTQYSTFFDGFENVTLEKFKIIPMENLPPIINLRADIIKDPFSYKFQHNAYDIDGFIQYVKWDVYRNNRDINNNSNWSLYFTSGKSTNISEWYYDFTDILGELKVICTVYDNYDLFVSQEYLINNICDNEPEIIFYNNIDWSKSIKIIDFSTKTNDLKWELIKKQVQWNVNINRIEWNLTPIEVIFSQDVKQIKFSYKSNC